MQTNVNSPQYRFDFLKYRFISVAFSVVLMFVGVITYVVKGGFSYHIDFTGGAEIRILFEKPVKISELRDVIGKKGWKDAIIQDIETGKKEFIIKIKDLDTGLENKIKTVLAEKFSDNTVKINSVDWVGAEVGTDTKWNAIKAVILSLIVLLLYIAIRSEFRFAVGAVSALLHDVLMVLVFLLFTGELISLHVLASVLAVLGYSLNDTIVIFSRIRENLKKMKGMSDYDVVNLSINQTLKRTILTSVSTFLSVLAILILGGEALRGLSIILALGIVVGTYSSIYIASAGMLAINSPEKASLKNEFLGVPKN
jgi:preprotein translocase subunit SecF